MDTNSRECASLLRFLFQSDFSGIWRGPGPSEHHHGSIPFTAFDPHASWVLIRHHLLDLCRVHTFIRASYKNSRNVYSPPNCVLDYTLYLKSWHSEHEGIMKIEAYFESGHHHFVAYLRSGIRTVVSMLESWHDSLQSSPSHQKKCFTLTLASRCFKGESDRIIKRRGSHSSPEMENEEIRLKMDCLKLIKFCHNARSR